MDFFNIVKKGTKKSFFYKKIRLDPKATGGISTNKKNLPTTEIILQIFRNGDRASALYVDQNPCRDRRKNFLAVRFANKFRMAVRGNL
jgi:hypothetical protein